ncbi:MAG TPA: BON domain-containing protein, partial [Burkholderiales bacterium]|nr:BON domain-containing protein [Burkholderiales bacterium]
MKLFKHLSAVLLALAFATVLGCAGGPQKESTGEYVSDSWITTKVKAALVDDQLVKATEVNVETFKGVVQLSGFVS